jgi:hypothetical protein
LKSPDIRTIPDWDSKLLKSDLKSFMAMDGGAYIDPIVINEFWNGILINIFSTNFHLCDLNSECMSELFTKIATPPCCGVFL